MFTVRSPVNFPHVLLSVGLAISTGSAGLAQAKPADLTIELNRLKQTKQGCQLTFVTSNQLNAPLSKLALEMAFFKTDGLLEKLSVLDFKDIPAGKSKVRQFAVKNIKCSDMGRLLLNDVSSCEGVSGVNCRDALKTQNRTKIVFGN